MSAKIIDLTEYQKEQSEQGDLVSAYQQLRDLMVSMFGPLDHIPEAPEADEGNRVSAIGD